MAKLGPIIVSHRMSDYGYWVVNVSPRAGQVVSVMIAQVGITPEQARELAMLAHGTLTEGIRP